MRGNFLLALACLFIVCLFAGAAYDNATPPVSASTATVTVADLPVPESTGTTPPTSTETVIVVPPSRITRLREVSSTCGPNGCSLQKNRSVAKSGNTTAVQTQTVAASVREKTVNSRVRRVGKIAATPVRLVGKLRNR